jgi:hypothetical protein
MASNTAAAATTSVIPIILNRTLPKLNPLQKSLQSWVQTMSEIESKKIGIIDLHPSIFAVSPRLDILFRNVHWQNLYKKIVRIISYSHFIQDIFDLFEFHFFFYLGLQLGTHESRIARSE